MTDVRMALAQLLEKGSDADRLSPTKTRSRGCDPARAERRVRNPEALYQSGIAGDDERESTDEVTGNRRQAFPIPAA